MFPAHHGSNGFDVLGPCVRFRLTISLAARPLVTMPLVSKRLVSA